MPVSSDGFPVPCSPQVPMKTHEPRLIRFDSKVYTLVQKQVRNADGTGSGPFYAREDTDPADWAFMPDLRFLAGLSDEPSFMRVVQQRHVPQTARPA